MNNEAKKEIEQFLTDGPQTKKTPLIRKVAELFREENFCLIFEILTWLRNNLKDDFQEKEKLELFRKRTAGEIIESGRATGCTDWALAFIVLARSGGIPTKYVETIRNKWLDIGAEDHIEGHVFAECYVDGKWYIIDPQEGDIKTAYRRFKIFKKGLDSWSIGIKNFDELKKQFLEFKEEFGKN